MAQFGCGYFNALRDPNMSGPTPVVIAGPSGVGKGTIIAKLQARFPNQFGFCVSHTTRQPRPGEENGTHYHFVEKSEMERGIEVADRVPCASMYSYLPFYCCVPTCDVHPAPVLPLTPPLPSPPAGWRVHRVRARTHQHLRD